MAFDPTGRGDVTAVSRRSANRSLIEFNGKRLSIAGWAKYLGVSSSTLHNRLRNLGWTVEIALTTPAPNRPKGAIDLTGQRFGRWTVISRGHRTRDGNALWLCRCDCGNEKTVPSSALRKGMSQSCGCLMRERSAEDSRARSGGKHPGWKGGVHNPGSLAWANNVLRTARRNSQRDGYTPPPDDYTGEQLAELYAAADGKCQICGVPESECTQRLHMDHDHETGIPRGFVCMTCNVMIGRDSPEILRAGADYLERMVNKGDTVKENSHGNGII